MLLLDKHFSFPQLFVFLAQSCSYAEQSLVRDEPVLNLNENMQDQHENAMLH